MSRDEDLKRWASAATWSRSDTLDPMATLLWRSENHPVQSSTSCVWIDLDRAPDWDRFVAATDWGTHLVPRLRQRLVEPALSGAVATAPPRWADDPTFDLGYHLRRERVADRREAFEHASQLALRPFDRSRPLWEAVLLEGLPEGAVYLLKIHHALADPQGTVQLLSLLQSTTRRHRAKEPIPEPATPRTADPVDLAAEGVRHDVAALPGRALSVARGALTAALNPGDVLVQTMRYAASVRRLVAAPPAPPSPLLLGRTGRRWEFRGFETPLEPLRTLGKASGSTLDEVAIAGVLGGLRLWHEANGEQVHDIPIAVRVSLDRADDLGNPTAAALIPGPADITDPVDRVAAVRGEMLSLHTERALTAMAAAAPALNRMPSLVGALALGMRMPADAMVFTVPGPPTRRYMAGAEVRGMYVFGPLPGVALTASVVALGDSACVGLNLDAAAVGDVDSLAEYVEAGFDELAAD